MRWLDIHDIAIALESLYPDTDMWSLSFPKLRQMVLDLPEFSDSADKCSEKILEAIQLAWHSER